MVQRSIPTPAAEPPARDSDMAGDACVLSTSTSGAASHDDDIKTPRYLIQTSSRLPWPDEGARVR